MNGASGHGDHLRPNFPEGKVYSGYKNAIRSIEYIDGIKVVRVWSYIAANEGFCRTLDYCSYVPTAFLFSLLEEQPDIVISSSPQLFTAIAGVACSTVRGVPHVFELRDLWPASILATSAMKPGRLYKMLEWMELLLYRRSRRILSFTKSFVAELTRRNVPEEKIDVVINGASLISSSPQPNRDARSSKSLACKDDSSLVT